MKSASLVVYFGGGVLLGMNLAIAFQCALAGDLVGVIAPGIFAMIAATILDWQLELDRSARR